MRALADTPPLATEIIRLRTGLDAARLDLANLADSAERQPPDNRTETALWTLLNGAPDEGVPIAHLIKATGMSRRWVYYQLNANATAGRAVQISRGRWRATHRSADDTP